MNTPTPKQYPKEIVIGDNVWSVKFFRKKKGHANTSGLCDPSTKTIWLKQGQTHTELMSTYIHEVLHAFEDEYNHPIPHKTIYALEQAIMNFLFANL